MLLPSMPFWLIMYVILFFPCVILSIILELRHRKRLAAKREEKP
jgi:hypothetical protein